MQRLVAGDQAALAQLIHTHFSALHRYATRLLDNAGEAEDVVQESFIRLWEQAASWRADKGGLSTWLHGIAHNLCVDKLRRRREAVSLDAEGETPDFPQLADPGHVLEKLEIAEQVELALRQLPARQRAALLLCYYQGFSGEEAAEILGLSLDALESLLARARRALKQWRKHHDF